MDWSELGKGFTAMAVSLGLITAALRLMPKSIIAQSAGLVLISGAMVILAKALDMMGGMTWEEIAKGLVTLAGSLVIIAGALYLMTAALPGAAALIVAAGALAILTPVLLALGGMSWEEIGKGLATLAGVFVVLGLAGLALTPVIPTLLGLGVAITLLGVGVALAGVGLLAFSAGLTALSVAGAAGAAALTAIAAAIIGLIPMAMKAVGEGLVLLAGVIANAGPQFTRAMTTLMLSLLNAIDRVAPRVINTIVTLLFRILDTIGNNVGRFVTAGVKIITGFLDGIANNIGKVITSATNVVTKFLDGIGKAVPKIVDAGYKMVLDILDGVTKSVNANSEAMGRAGGNLAVAIIQGIVKGIAAGIGQVVQAARNMAANALQAAKEFLGIASPSKEFVKIGAFVVQGFRKGIDGNADQIQGSFQNLRQMLTDMIRGSSEDIEKLEEKLKKLTNARNKDYDAIRKTRTELAQARKEHAASSAALTELTKKWTDDKEKLRKLAGQYDVLGEKIKAANQKLADAKKTRDDYQKSVKDQFSDLPDIGAEDTAASFAADLRKQITATQEFATALQELRKRGLNDTLYKELLSKGPGAMPFIQDLLATGDSGVKQLNELSSQLDKVAGDLGTTASKQLYQAAVDSAAGLVKGLENQQKAIEIQMDKIADAMVAAIKRKLGIRSPSREFMKIGKWSNEGLALGLSKYDAVVRRSAEDVGHNAIESMRKTISGLSDIVAGDMNMNPVITPVLDLTSVKKDAGQLDSLVGSPKLMVDAAYSSARHAQAAYHANENAFESEGMPFREQSVEQTVFNQYNSSPKALSEAEIYRQTSSLISSKKGEVNPNAVNG